MFYTSPLPFYINFILISPPFLSGDNSSIIATKKARVRKGGQYFLKKKTKKKNLR